MIDFKRTVNRNYLISRIKLYGYSLKTLGLALDPPISEGAVCKLISITHPYKDEGRIKQIAAVLYDSDVLLFPFMPVEQKGTNKGKAD